MDDRRITFWFLLCSGIAAALIAVFLGKLVDLYFSGRDGRPSDTAILIERLLASFVSGAALAIPLIGRY